MTAGEIAVAVALLLSVTTLYVAGPRLALAVFGWVLAVTVGWWSPLGYPAANVVGIIGVVVFTSWAYYEVHLIRREWR